MSDLRLVPGIGTEQEYEENEDSIMEGLQRSPSMQCVSISSANPAIS